MKKAGRNVKKIVAAVSVTFFQLVACGAAILAWFIAYQHGDVGGTDFEVTNQNCDIDSVKLYKFIYNTETIGTKTYYKYENPEEGHAHSYTYNYDEESFGYTDGEDTFHPVSVMNVYDPVDLLINSATKNLRDLYCGVVYEITLRTTDFDDTTLLLTTSLVSKETTGNQILLSDYVDFDVFYQSDVDAITGNSYYPRYPSAHPFDPTDESITDEDILYHKLSYLSEQETTHQHFYYYNPSNPTETGPKQSSLTLVDNESISFTDNYFKIYIYANYAYSQLQGFHNDASLVEGILAVYDFKFAFTVGGAE